MKLWPPIVFAGGGEDHHWVGKGAGSIQGPSWKRWPLTFKENWWSDKYSVTQMTKIRIQRNEREVETGDYIFTCSTAYGFFRSTIPMITT